MTEKIKLLSTTDSIVEEDMVEESKATPSKEGKVKKLRDFPKSFNEFDYKRTYTYDDIQYDVDWNGENEDNGKKLFLEHQRILLKPKNQREIAESPTIYDVFDAKYYWDGKKLETVRPLLLGITVKKIQQNDDENRLELKATITLKLPISKDYESQGEILKSLKEEAKKLMTRIGLNLNMDDNKCLQPRNFKLNQKNEKYTDYSMSDHFVASVDATSVYDCCPFNIAEYNLSIKLNALDSDNARQKVKLVWASRMPFDFIQFQYTSFGSNISANDTLSVLPKYKKEKHLKAFKQIPQSTMEMLKFHEVIGEVDEILIQFNTRNKQVTNITNIVLPCIIVPMIFALSDDKESKIQLLMGAVLTMVYSMPTEFQLSTTLWYFEAIILVLIAYLWEDARPHVLYIPSVTAVLLFCLNYNNQRDISTQNKIRIRQLVKDVEKETPKPGWWDTCNYEWMKASYKLLLSLYEDFN